MEKNGFPHIAASQLNGSSQKDEPSAYDRVQKYFWLIRRRWWLLILLGLIGSVYKYNEVLQVREQFTSVSTLILDGSSTDRATALLGIPGARYGYQNEMYILKSDKLSKLVAQSLLDSFYSKRNRDTLQILKAGPGKIDGIERIARKVQGAVRFFSEEENNIIRIQSFAYDPVEASTIANAFATMYKENNLNDSKSQIRETKEFLKQKISETQDSLINIEYQILNFYKNNDFTNYDLNTRSILEQITNLVNQLNSIDIELVSNREEIKAIDSTLVYSRKNETDFLVNATDNFIAYFSDEILRLEVQKEEELTRLSSAQDTLNPRVKVIEDKLTILKDKLQFYLNKKLDNSTLLSSVDGSIAKYWIELNARKIELINKNKTIPIKKREISNQIQSYNSQLEIIPFKRMELERLEQRKARLVDAFNKFYDSYMDMELAEASEGGYVRILDSAKPNYSPINKKTTKGVFQGGFFGILIAIGLIIALDNLDDRIKSDEDLITVSKPVIAAIPSMDPSIMSEYEGKKFVDYRGNFISTKLVTVLQSLSGISEMYRRLRSDFTFSLPDKQSKSILVTSSNPQEGKSVSVSNLSIVIAQSGKKVLLIDADLRRPNIDIIFGISSEQGLSDCIIGQADYDDIIQSTVIENLNIITAGSQVPNPSELLGSDGFRKLFSRAMEEYDFVIIDSPPVNSVIDAVTISESIDMIMLVVRAGKTKKKEVNNAIQVLQYSDHKIKGILLNDVHQRNFITEYNYYNNYNYYGNRDIEAQNKRKNPTSFWDKLNA